LRNILPEEPAEGMMKHTLLPKIHEGAFDDHKTPVSSFLETHARLALSDKDQQIKATLQAIESQLIDCLYEYTSKLDGTYKRLLNGDIKSAKNAIALMRGFKVSCQSGLLIYVQQYIGLVGFSVFNEENEYLAKKINDWFEYYSRLAVEADTDAQPPEAGRPEMTGTADKQPTVQAQDNKDPQILLDLRDAGQVYKENGEWKTYSTTEKFITWCLQNGYKDDITPEFVFHEIKTACTLETIKHYFRDNREKSQ
jgi:hypothetical protein